MRLGIAVVYLVLPGDDWLLDLHLHYIEQCTTAPFTIYAATNRLANHLVDRLAEKPFVRLCAIPNTEHRGSREDSYYLERLITTAMDEGCTHVAILHVDSFPIRVGWAIELEQAISSKFAFAAAVRERDGYGKPSTAGLFFSREFYTHYRPRLLLSPEDLRSRSGRTYARKLWNPKESGGGYGLVAFREGLQWLRLQRTNREEDHYYYGSIHGDLFFHLGAAAHVQRSFPKPRERVVFTWLRKTISAPLPDSVKRLFRRWIPSRILYPERAHQQRSHEQVKARLLENPALYIEHLRGMADQTSRSDIRNPNEPRL